MSSAATSHVSCALVCLRTGSVLEMLDGAVASQRIRDLALAARELLARESGPDELNQLCTRLGGDPQSGAFREISFFSERGVHVIQMLARRPELALVAVGYDPEQLALVSSELRACAQRFENVP